MRFSNKTITVALAVALTAAGVSLATQAGRANAPDGFSIAVDDKGAIRVPDVDYRKDWVALGTWAVAAEEGSMGSQGFHIVYTQPETVAAFRESGQFPDGAVLIKELFTTATEDMTTGTVNRADKTAGWFVMIKDRKNRYPDNKLWGNGWGWAYFDAADRRKTQTTDYVADCQGCHLPAQESDWIYLQGYPVLQGK